MGGIAGFLFSILIYGSAILTLLSLIPLATYGVILLVGKWDADALHSRWKECKKPIAILALPLIVLVSSVVALEYYRSYPNGHKLVYMNSSACYMCRGSSVVINQHIIEKSLSTRGNIVTGKLGNGSTFTLNTATGSVVYTMPTKSTR